LSGRSEAIRALAEINLVDVDLENLILAQAVLDLEGEQGLLNLRVKGLSVLRKSCRPPAW
jgi:hypothetical protein